MPFISQYSLSLPEIRRLRITDTYSLHRTVYGLFPLERENMQENSGILFADKGGNARERRILILSQREPQTPELGNLKTRRLEREYFEFSSYRFEITINPVYRSNASGKTIPLRGREEIAEWFCNKSPSWGFAVRSDSLLVSSISVDIFRKAEKNITLGKAALTGFLDVTEKEKFSASVCQGIGRARSFGCGLLQIAPAL